MMLTLVQALRVENITLGMREPAMTALSRTVRWRGLIRSVERVDNKEITLSIDKQTEKLYFTTMLVRGKFDSDGRDKMCDKYYLFPDQYRKFAPPDLLCLAHVKLRDVVKLQLKQFQGLVSLQPVFGDLEIGSVFDEAGKPNKD